MYRISRYTVGIGLFMLVAMTPGVAAAQSTDAVRLALLKQMVVLLQQQLTLLLEAQQSTEAPDGHADHFAGASDVERSYTYTGPSSVSRISNTQHRDFFSRAVELAPDSLESNLSELIVYRDATESSDAYVDAVGDTNGNFSWRFGVNAAFLNDNPTDSMEEELIVHELGHIVAFEDGLDLTDNVSCHSLVEEDDFCPDPNSYYGKFIDAFWSDRMLDRLQAGGYGYELRSVSTYQDHFVSDYASVSPHEDFAESFAHFVLYEDTDDGSITAEKQDFFKRFSGTRALKSEILTEL